MTLQETDLKIKKLESELEYSPNKEEIKKEIKELQETAYKNLTAWDRVYLARKVDRPKSCDYIHLIFNDFIELHGDQYFSDDNSIYAGLGLFNDIPVTIIAQAKGHTVEQNIFRNFGMTSPEGFRKALRLAHQAEKFKRPIITFIDTSGAYPGMGAEERGQARAIAKCLEEFSTLKTPVIAVVISEGGSGGALALSVADRIIMLENAIYSILSPEGFASILWKDGNLAKKAADVMKLTSFDLYNLGIIDHIIEEPIGGASVNIDDVANKIKDYIQVELNKLVKIDTDELIESRYQKFRRIGR